LGVSLIQYVSDIEEGITISKLCREKLRDYSLLARLQDTTENINRKIVKEGRILNLLKIAIKTNARCCYHRYST